MATGEATRSPQRRRTMRGLLVLGLCVVGAAVAVLVLVLVLTAGRDAEPYDSLDDLRDAYMNAGGSCESWTRHTDAEVQAAFGIGSGDCDTFSAVLMLSMDTSQGWADDRDETDSPRLVGPNWLIMADAEVLDTIEGKLGGERFEPQGGNK